MAHYPQHSHPLNHLRAFFLLLFSLFFRHSHFATTFALSCTVLSFDLSVVTEKFSFTESLFIHNDIILIAFTSPLHLFSDSHLFPRCYNAKNSDEKNLLIYIIIVSFSPPLHFPRVSPNLLYSTPNAPHSYLLLTVIRNFLLLLNTIFSFSHSTYIRGTITYI